MKQHVSTEQAKEIYEKMCAYLPTIGLAPKGYTNLSEYMNIGHMIKILGCRFEKIDYDFFTNNYYVKVKDKGTYGKPELCDALFEAVKRVL